MTLQQKCVYHIYLQSQTIKCSILNCSFCVIIFSQEIDPGLVFFLEPTRVHACLKLLYANPNPRPADPLLIQICPPLKIGKHLNFLFAYICNWDIQILKTSCWYKLDSFKVMVRKPQNVKLCTVFLKINILFCITL